MLRVCYTWVNVMQGWSTVCNNYRRLPIGLSWVFVNSNRYMAGIKQGSTDGASLELEDRIKGAYGVGKDDAKYEELQTKPSKPFTGSAQLDDWDSSTCYTGGPSGWGTACGTSPCSIPGTWASRRPR